MKYKQNNVQIWFLDADLVKSAQYLTDPALDRSLNGAFCALVDARLYFSGIRTKTAYSWRFSKERRDETMDRFFPGWPFRTRPQMKYYSSRASKWARMCREHVEYVRAYMSAMLDEYAYRHGREHGLRQFLDWDAGVEMKIPAANLKSVSLPWKSLKPRFRRRDVLEGYRLQFMDTFCWEDPMGAYMSSNRDVPDFVVRHYNLDTASMVT